MNGSTLTASAIVSFSQDLELRLATFYKELEQRFPEHAELFHSFVLSCEKTGKQVVRTYQETVSDALETGYSFGGISLEAYRLDWDLPEAPSLREAVEMAQALETSAVAFYSDVAGASESLLATIPRAFKRAGRTHQRRREALEALLPDPV